VEPLLIGTEWVVVGTIVEASVVVYFVASLLPLTCA
jgi:hypothetical protein